MPIVYKKSGKEMNVNDDMLPYLDELNLSLEKPIKKTAKKPVKKKPVKKAV